MGLGGAFGLDDDGFAGRDAGSGATGAPGGADARGAGGPPPNVAVYVTSLDPIVMSCCSAPLSDHCEKFRMPCDAGVLIVRTEPGIVAIVTGAVYVVPV